MNNFAGDVPEDVELSTAPHLEAGYEQPGCVVFVGLLPKTQDGNGWWSKLAMMKIYVNMGFTVAAWRRTDETGPLGELLKVDPFIGGGSNAVVVEVLDRQTILPHIAAVIDRYAPHSSNPDLLRDVFFDSERKIPPKFVADFADCFGWIEQIEGRDFKREGQLHSKPSIYAWRPEVLARYDIVTVPRSAAGERVKMILEEM